MWIPYFTIFVEKILSNDAKVAKKELTCSHVGCIILENIVAGDKYRLSDLGIYKEITYIVV